MLEVQQHVTPAARPANKPPVPSPSPALDRSQARTLPGEPHHDPLSGLLREAVEERAIAHGAVQQPTVQRDEESTRQLTKLAKPKILVAPDKGRIQKRIVDALEAQIKLDKKADATLLEALMKEQRGGEFKPAAQEHAELFLGGIELTTIPNTDEQLLQDATLIDLPGDNAFKARPMTLAYPLATRSGVAADLVENTLRTMIQAKQIKYLRAAGLPNNEWKIIVEIHYIRSRGKNRPLFHKDTLGQTLFVNLNYVTDTPTAGAEFMLNPPPVPEWEQHVSTNMPKAFYDDLVETRKRLSPLTQIELSDIPAQGVLTFVDEAIHHRTPVLGHRSVTGASFAAFLKQKYPDWKLQEAAALHKTYTEGSWALSTYFGEKWKWITWLEMASQTGTKYTRPDFVGAKMGSTEIDELLEFGDQWSREVSIPGVGTKPIFPNDGNQRPPLKRTMSARALKKQLPPDMQGERRFFRNWVRVVKI